jgi:hypothetical protein
MANIIIKDKPVHHLSVILTGMDKERLISKAKYNGLTITRLSHILGLSRVYLHHCIKTGEFEAFRFIHLQSILDLNLLSKTDFTFALERMLSEVCENLPNPMV